MAPLTGGHGVAPEEVNLLVDVRKDLKKKDIHAYWSQVALASRTEVHMWQLKHLGYKTIACRIPPNQISSSSYTLPSSSTSKGVKPWIQTRPLKDANQAIVGMENGRARYRYVLLRALVMGSAAGNAPALLCLPASSEQSNPAP
ncbi:hypothetical protein EDB81DRAFT_849526 [Dactylonectria macrodidyma]|uniref:Uncharacterized protein n=1 Tax=Dactylonectria macrodidyma TaxID=307937 RepID=A0A9P9JM37_9HYPO|nr:hypothetical protein EDB81DRAFT_849526 [Dactylonectria macrodidyma]